ncbi:MAG: hypothetical protein H7832_13900 [Magnetococcus sp. DMHC-6]
MVWLFFLLTLFAAASSNAESETPATIQGDIFFSGRFNSVRDGLVNRENLLQQPDHEAEMALVLAGDLYDFRYAIRAPLTAEHLQDHGSENWHSEADPTLLEFAKELDLGNNSSLIIGKTNLQWDVGYAAHPIGFFDKEVELSDIEDRLRRTEGQPLIALTHIEQAWDLTAVLARDTISEEDGEEQGLTQWAVKAGTQWGLTNLTLLLQKPEGERIGVGGAATYVVGNDIELHGSLFARKGTRRPIHQSLLNALLRYYEPDEQPVDAWRIQDDKWYPRWVVGSQWTSQNLYNLLIEWVHDAQGLNHEEWKNFLSLARFHEKGGINIPEQAVSGNLALDALTLRNQGSRQDYLFLRILKSGQEWEPSLSSFIGLADGSYSINARLTYAGATNWQIWSDARINIGPPDTEFQLVPESGFISLTYRYIF